MARRCILCGCDRSKVVFTEFHVQILRCRDCGHTYSGYSFDQHYDGFFGEEVASDEQFWWNEAHKAMHVDFGRRFLEGRAGRLLDVGCGLGYFLKRAAAYPGWELHGYEISPAAVRFARSRLGLRNVQCGKVEEAAFPDACFDIITLWDVIEHVPDPCPMLQAIRRFLKNEGILFLHTPNVNFQLPKARLKKLFKGEVPGEHYIEATEHANIYSMKTVGEILRRNGFSRVEFTHLHPVQSVNGSRNGLLKALKNMWYESTRALHALSLGRVNLDGLFVAASK